MFQALSSWRSRLFGAPAAPQSESAAAQGQEWASLDLDPELAAFGAKVPLSAGPEAAAPTIAFEAQKPGAARVLEQVAQFVEAQGVDTALDESRLLAGGMTLDGGDGGDGGDIVELDFSSESPAAFLAPDLPPPTSTAAPAAEPAVTLPLKGAIKTRRAPARKGVGKAEPAATGSPKTPDGAKKPPRRRGLALGGAWKLPGVDGYMPSFIDETVDDVRLELMLTPAED